MWRAIAYFGSVDQTENNICKIFADAEKQDAVVFLDEVDTAAGKHLSNPEDTEV